MRGRDSQARQGGPDSADLCAPGVGTGCKHLDSPKDRRIGRVHARGAIIAPPAGGTDLVTSRAGLEEDCVVKCGHAGTGGTDVRVSADVSVEAASVAAD